MSDYFRSLRFRLTLWFVGLLALMSLALSGLVYFALQQALLNNADAQLRIAADRSLAGNIDADPLRQLTLIGVAPARLLGLDGSPIQVDELFPRSIATSPDMLALAGTGGRRYETVSTADGLFRLYSAPVSVNEARVAVIQVAQSLQNEISTLNELRRLLAVAIPILLAISALGGAFLANRALAPMQRVRTDVEGIIESGDLSRRVARSLQPDEVGALAATFDRLLERVQQAVKRERQFIADASHELRSPLTALKGELSVALGRPRSAAEYQATLEELESSVDDVNALVDDLLTLARADAPSPGGGEPVDIVALAARVCERNRPLASAKAIALELGDETGGEGATVMGDRLKLQRVLTNLVDNAVRYTPEGGRVDIVVSRRPDAVIVAVQDTGRGIPSHHAPHIFERFYRIEPSRSREAGGTGLGLAIAKSIVEAHGGAISVSSPPGLGACFSIRLPVGK